MNRTAITILLIVASIALAVGAGVMAKRYRTATAAAQ